jgi:hypothetical protein
MNYKLQKILIYNKNKLLSCHKNPIEKNRLIPSGKFCDIQEN